MFLDPSLPADVLWGGYLGPFFFQSVSCMPLAAYSRRICPLQSVFHVLSRNNIASVVENTSSKPLEMPFLRL